VDHILHAGDIGSLALLSELEAIAPVTAVYGNCDDFAVRATLPAVVKRRFEGLDFVLTHGDQLGSPTPQGLYSAYPDAEVIIYGHTHRPLLTTLDLIVTVMNPGGAGHRRFNLPPSVGIMELESGLPPRNRPVAMLALLLAAALDTIRLVAAVHPPLFDGRASIEEYGAPSIGITRPGGVTSLWLRRDSAYVYLAASMPDSTFSWADDLVISLDVPGDRDPGPGHYDFQWYFRRMLDSSVVYRGEGGRWRAPQDDPDWRLGAAREGGGWEVRSQSTDSGWSLEIRFDPEYFTPPPGRSTGLAVREFDDQPQGWYAWPHPSSVRQPTEVERRPALWAVISP
jgi:putative phosphoesterase